MIREEPFVCAHGLVGTLTLPDDGASSTAFSTAVIILSAGLLPRSGPARLHALLARSVAAHGHLVLRYDASAIGDSPPRTDGLPIPELAAREPREVVEALASRLGVQRVVLTGICSGAYAAFRSAADPRVAGAVLINPQDFVGDAAWGSYVQAQRYLGRSARSGRSWLNLLTGRSNYRRLAATAWRRVADGLSGRSRAAQAQATAVAADFDALLDAGRQVRFVLSDLDAARDHVQALFGSRVGTAAPVTIIAGADHLFLDPDHRAEAVREITAACLAILGPAARETLEL